MNLERASTPQSTILFDDCFPHDRLLKKYRPDLSIHTIAAPRTSLCLVRKLDPSRFLADNLERLVAEFMALDYSYLEKDRARKLNLVPNDWDKIRLLF